MLKQRLITGVVLIAFALALLFLLPSWACTLVATLLVLGAGWEWSQFLALPARWQRYLYMIFLLVLALAAFWIIPLESILVVAWAWWLLATWLVLTYPVTSRLWANSRLCRGLMGVVTIVPAYVAILAIYHYRPLLLLLLFVLIWGADSGAYFVGRCYGRHKLLPRVSPGKSWEGVAGGMALVVIVVAVVAWYVKLSWQAIGWLMLASLLILVVSIIGDLFESMLKRACEVKDSGSLLPGHGGLLDRIDSLLAAAPTFLLLLTIVLAH